MKVQGSITDLKVRAWDAFNAVYVYSKDADSLAAFFNYCQACVDGGNDLTLELAIGRQDDDGTEIYAGDVLSNSFRDGYDGRTSEVVYRNQAWYLKTGTVYRPVGNNLGWCSISEKRYGGVKVIGTIHDMKMKDKNV